MNGATVGTRNETVHQLRGLAILAVVGSHLFLMTFGAMGLVQAYLGLPVTEPRVTSELLFSTSLVLGQFGVGLFFVISGYVIPAALLRMQAGQAGQTAFLFARLIRLWPTYAVSFLIGVAILLSLQEGGPSFGIGDVLGHLALGFRDLIGTLNIDGVIWTLEIEVKFYIVTALFLPFCRDNLLRYILILSLVSLAITYAVTWLSLSSAAWLDSLMQFLNVMILMQIGTLAWLYEKKRLQLREYGIGLVIVGSCFALATRPGEWAVGSTAQVKAIYLFAATFFLAVYAGTKAPPQKIAVPMAWLGSISYPLYAIHAIAGYAITLHLVSLSLPMILAASIALLIVVCAAWMIHLYVEAPSQRLSARICLAHRTQPQV